MEMEEYVEIDSASETKKKEYFIQGERSQH